MSRAASLSRPPLITPLVLADGVTDATSALATADSSGPVLIGGNYRVSGNLTLNNRPQFLGNGRLTIDSGKVVTLPAGVDAPPRQIFYGAGTCASLPEAWLEWFVGDARGSEEVLPTIECRATIQAAFNALAPRGTLRHGGGSWLIDGATVITVSQDRNFEGLAKNTAAFRWQGTTTNGFYLPPSTSDEESSLRGFRFEPHTPGTIPAAGTALDIQASFVNAEEFTIVDPYIGLNQEAIAGGNCRDFHIEGALSIGRRIKALNDVNHSDFVVEGLGNWATFTGITGTFQLNEAITLSTGQAGTIRAIYGGGKYRITVSGFAPTTPATVTGGTSGATATLSAVTIPHQLGGTRLIDKVEAFVENNGEGALGGLYSLTSTRSVGSTGRGGAAFNRSTDVFYDTAYLGGNVAGLYKCMFTASWFSSAGSSGGKGLLMTNCIGLRFFGPECTNNGDAGLHFSTGCSDCEVHGADINGNCTLSGLGDIVIDAGVSGIRIFGGSAGYAGDNGITAPKALVIGAGAGDHLAVVGLNVPSGAVTNGATGSDQTWLGVLGTPDRGNVASYTDAANDGAAATAGVPVGGKYRNGSVLMIRVA